MKLFNLKQARKLVAPSQPTVFDGSGRRKFIKNVGFFALSANPIAETFRTISLKPFEIKVSSDHFAVLRRNEMVWSISRIQFEEGYSLDLSEKAGDYLLQAENLRFINTQLSFSFKARIFYEKREWQMQAIIPEFGIDEKINFIDWLDGKIKLPNGIIRNQVINTFNDHDQIGITDDSSIKIDNQWVCEIQGKGSISSVLNEMTYLSDMVVLSAARKVPELLELAPNAKSMVLTIPKFLGWNRFVSGIGFYDSNHLAIKEDAPELNFVFSSTPNDEKHTAFWVAENNGSLTFLPEKRLNSGFMLEKYLYYSEYVNRNKPDFYLSGNLLNNGQWMTNQLGSFNFINDEQLPVFEAFGSNNQITDHFFEPRMRAFQPFMSDALPLVSDYKNPLPVSFNPQKITNNSSPQDPVKLKKLPRDVKENASKLSVGVEEVTFAPRILKIKLLRPEDLILLEFELIKFKFIRKGEETRAELANPNDPGVVIIHFQSQHTLEEAIYESTNILLPPPDKPPLPAVPVPQQLPISLPLKQIRAKKSRLVYELPIGHEGFLLNVDGLLDWSKFNLVVHPRAWIKVESFALAPTPYPPGPAILTKPPTVATTTKFIDRNALQDSYAVVLASNRKVKALNQNVYDSSVLDKLMVPEKSITLSREFNLGNIKKIDLSVGPIPEANTSIEAPALLYISPNQVSDFTHKIELDPWSLDEKRNPKNLREVQPVKVLDSVYTTTKSDIVELWHTRMGTKLKNGKVICYHLEKLQSIRALWAYDGTREWPDPNNLPRVYKRNNKNQPFMASLDADDRMKLVHETSNYSIPGYQPTPVPVKMLMLTSLGAYIDWHVYFKVPLGPDTFLNIVEWEHRATLGRDHYVKIVKKGYLFPFGHRAVLVKVTERKFNKATKAAVNRQRMYIVVLEKEVNYARKDVAGKFIQFPFQSIRINTPFTPDIDDPSQNPIKESNSYNFYVKVGGEGFQFDIVATDKEGIDHRIRMPLVFLEPGIARDSDEITAVIDDYNGIINNGKNSNALYNNVQFYGQKVAYAGSLVEGDTLFETNMVEFGAQKYPAVGSTELKFHPMMQSSSVYIKQLEELTGSRKLAKISLEDDENDGMVFAKVSNAALDFSSGGTDKSGGFISPNMTITGLSKLQGPIGGDIEDLKNLVFKASKFFENLGDFHPSAKIFGVIDIFSLFPTDSPLAGSFDEMISAVNRIREEIDNIKEEILFLENEAKDAVETSAKELIATKMAEFKHNIADKVNELLGAINGSTPRIPNLKTYVTESAFYAEYKWNPDLAGSDMTIIPDLLKVHVDNPKTALTINTKFVKPFDPAQATSLNGSARLEKFIIDIVPLLEVKFNYIEFKSGSSEKTDVKVDIDAQDPIAFKGALSFVNSLQSIIPSTGFSDDGPYIDLKLTGVSVGFNLSIPSVEVGILSISNISLGACVTLPFTGDPLTLSFNFSTRENPFCLTVSCFGGGGYFMLVTTLHGIQSVEAAFEFGASVSLDIGVASGGVSIMGGFYFKVVLLDEDTTEVTLTGYIRINGRLSILGIITVSLEFYLALTAVLVGGKVQKIEGEATLKVKIEVLFFSKTVECSVRRELAGADADPKFGEMILLDDWKEYCLAFAG